MSRGLECYFGTDVWTGSVRMLAPNLFAAEVYNTPEGIKTIKTITDPDLINEMSQMIIQNNLPYRGAIISDDIHKDYVSKKVVKKIKRYLAAQEIEKAGKKVWGYCWARIMNYMGETEEILESTDNLEVGKWEKREMEPVLAHCYKVNNNYVFNVPDNLFAVLTTDGEIKTDLRPEFIHTGARSHYLYHKDKTKIIPFTLSRRALDDLETACFEGDKVLRDDMIKDMVKWAIPLLKEKHGD